MNKKNIKIIFIIIILIMVILGTTLLTAQTTRIPKPRSVPGTVTNKRPLEYDKGKYGGVLLDSLVGDIKTYNESQSNDKYSSDIIVMMQPYLMDINYDTGKWEVHVGNHKKGSTGKGYDVKIFDDKTMEITIHLRKDIYWTDGTRMTADDWVFYHNEIICDDDIGSAANPSTYIELEDGDEVQYLAEKINRWSFKFYYPRSQGEIEQKSVYNIMPKHVLKPVLDAQGSDGIIELWGLDTSVGELVGYGPWIIDSNKQGEAITLKRNERYFEKDEWNNRLPYLNTYIISIVADEQIGLLKFQNKELDMLTVPADSFQQVVKAAEVGGYSVWNGGPNTGITFVAFNQNETSERMKGTPTLKWFKDKNFRKAMNYLVDRETIVKQVYNGLGEPQKSFIHPYSQYFDSSVVFDIGYNPKKAEKLLEEIGMRDRNGDGVREDSEGNIVEFELLSSDHKVERKKMAPIIAKEWTSFGVKCNPVIIDFNTLSDLALNSYDWESLIIGITGGLFPGGSNVWPSDGNLHMWYPGQDTPATSWEAEVDELYDLAQYEPDFETRKALWLEMYGLIYEEAPLIPLVRKYVFYAFYDKLGNIYWDIAASVGDDNAVRLYMK